MGSSRGLALISVAVIASVAVLITSWGKETAWGAIAFCIATFVIAIGSETLNHKSQQLQLPINIVLGLIIVLGMAWFLSQIHSNYFNDLTSAYQQAEQEE